ncbi:MAG: CheR family methyltransferase [Gammaproteobacteria bacterium]|nr:CheR family methyltransferase [Gammaproteobacteria bacterium]
MAMAPGVSEHMAVDKIQDLLKNKIGLHADTVGLSSIERAISHRMSHLRLASISSYYSLIKNNGDEFDELVEEVVVPETWFFRNKYPFEALNVCVSAIAGQQDGSAEREPLKILSLPCATGEEPYSIAMALMMAGLDKDDFHIDGIDVSKRAIAKARRSIYGKHSFRENDIDIQSRFFNKISSGYQILPEVQALVSFDRANVITDTISPANDYYDVIFCRNLLIYFNKDTQCMVLDKLRQMLKPGGYLFVGHAEGTQVSKQHFDNVDIPKSFAYRKISDSNTNMAANNIGPVNKLKAIYDQLVAVTKKDSLLSNRLIRATAARKSPQGDKVSATHAWKKVEKLIEGGHYDDAAAVCEGVLESDPENADGYYFLGLISNLCGSHGGAESLLKKAIYLSPNHQKALGLSVLLAEKRGDVDSAEFYRRREIKARERNKR